jgi:hypothetical protein
VQEINFGNFTYSKDEKGNFIYKAKDSKAINKKGNLKPQYKDLPRVKAIYSIEENWTKEFESIVIEGLKEGLKQLK